MGGGCSSPLRCMHRPAAQRACSLTPGRPRADDILRGLLSHGDIQFCRRENGQYWLLGSGTHGKVSGPRALTGRPQRGSAERPAVAQSSARLRASGNGAASATRAASQALLDAADAAQHMSAPA